MGEQRGGPDLAVGVFLVAAAIMAIAVPPALALGQSGAAPTWSKRSSRKTPPQIRGRAGGWADFGPSSRRTGSRRLPGACTVLPGLGGLEPQPLGGRLERVIEARVCRRTSLIV